jgi:predicted transcriptional regulator
LSERQGVKELSEGGELLDKLLSSDVKAELLALFHGSPGIIDRLDGVARRIGRTASEIEADVKDLVDLGVLLEKKFGGSEVIYFDRKKDAEIRQVISDRIKREGG